MSLLEIVKENNDEKARNIAAKSKIHGETVADIVLNAITPEMIKEFNFDLDNTKITTTEHAASVQVSGKSTYNGIEFFIETFCNHRAEHMDYYEVGVRVSTSNCYNLYKDDHIFIFRKNDRIGTPVCTKDKNARNIAMGEILLQVHRSIDNARKHDLAYGEYSEQYGSMSFEYRIDEVRRSPYLSDFEKSEIIATLNCLIKTRDEEVARRSAASKAYLETEQRAKTRYEREYKKYSAKCLTIWEDFVRDSFQPWSYKEIKVIPRNVSICIEDCDLDDTEKLTEGIAESLIFVFNVIGEPDAEGYYNVLYPTSPNIRRTKIFGTIVTETIFNVTDPYAISRFNNNIRPLGLNLPNTIKSAYFNPMEAPLLTMVQFPNAPDYNVIEDDKVASIA